MNVLLIFVFGFFFINLILAGLALLGAPTVFVDPDIYDLFSIPLFIVALVNVGISGYSVVGIKRKNKLTTIVSIVSFIASCLLLLVFSLGAFVTITESKGSNSQKVFCNEKYINVEKTSARKGFYYIIDGEINEKYQSLGSLIISKNCDHYAYIADRGDAFVVVLDNIELKTYDHERYIRLVFGNPLNFTHNYTQLSVDLGEYKDVFPLPDKN